VEKQILRWSYLLGLVCFAISIIWRGLGTVGVVPFALNAVQHTTFFKGAALLFATAIATAARIWSEAPKS
jgi:hypothetical protein